MVDLIESNSHKWRVHTFGVGQGASTELVKKCAVAGKGHYFFIQQPTEIEKKVMEALSKNFYEYLNIKDLKLLTHEGNIIESVVDFDTVAHGSSFRFFYISPVGKPKTEAVSLSVYDPNTGVSHEKVIKVTEIVGK